MKIGTDDITKFMLSLGLMQDHASQILQRANCSSNYTEELLSALFPANILLPSSSEYAISIAKYFGSRARLNASAIFAPESVDQVAAGVKTVEFFNRPFAVRGQGHTSHPGMSGIEDGILFSMEKMNEITISPSKQVTSLGAGNRWGDVYETLERDGIAVTGGQLSVVGVAGLLTGNGLSNFLSSRGFSSADVVNYQVVLAGGRIVNANATHNADLWWALKGGSNNFGIVTRFDMNTFPLSDGIWSGTFSYNMSQAKAIAATFYDLQTGPLLENPQLDVTYAGMFIPAINFSSVDLLPFTENINFTGSYPAAIKPLYDVGPQSVAVSRKTLTEAATLEVTPDFLEVYNKRVNRANINVKANKELYEEISTMLFAHYASSKIAGHTVGISWNAVTPHVIRETNRKGGIAGGWQEVNQNCINLRTNWESLADDAEALRMDTEFMEKLAELALERDALLPNQWANNAVEDVAVMKSYGEEDFQKLLAVSQKYDEAQTFQRLCPGGYKLRA